MKIRYAVFVLLFCLLSVNCGEMSYNIQSIEQKGGWSPQYIPQCTYVGQHMYTIGIRYMSAGPFWLVDRAQQSPSNNWIVNFEPYDGIPNSSKFKWKVLCADPKTWRPGQYTGWGIVYLCNEQYPDWCVGTDGQDPYLMSRQKTSTVSPNLVLLDFDYVPPSEGSYSPITFWPHGIGTTKIYTSFTTQLFSYSPGPGYGYYIKMYDDRSPYSGYDIYYYY